jgi:hypothetical protein
VIGVVLVIGVVSMMSRSEGPAVVPQLIGVSVDPQLDSLRPRLEAADVALGYVSVAPILSSARTESSRPARTLTRSGDSRSTDPRWIHV